MRARRISWYAVVVTPRELLEQSEQPKVFGPYRSSVTAYTVKRLLRDPGAVTYFDDGEYDIAVVAMAKPD